MIRVAYLITDLEIGGAELVLERLVTRLDRKRFQTLVLSITGEGPVGKRMRDAGIGVVELRMKGKLDARSIPRAVKAISDFDPDVLHSALFHGNLMGRLLSSLRRVPRTVCWVHTKEGRRYYFPLERFTSKGFDRVVCVSEAIASHVRRQMGVRRPLIIYNGVPIPDNTKGIKAELGAKTVVAAAGRLVKGKGVWEFLEMARNFPEAAFVLIGSGEEEPSLRKKAGPNVVLAGYRADVPSLLVDADLFVHPSTLGEGFPTVVVEAMAAGCPVVASDVGGTREAVGDAGIVAKPERIPGEVARLLSDESLRRDLGARARRRAEEFFSAEKMAASYEKLYRELVLELP